VLTKKWLCKINHKSIKESIGLPETVLIELRHENKPCCHCPLAGGRGCKKEGGW